MSKCNHPGCNAEISWSRNVDTNKRVPLVPYDDAYPKAIRYRKIDEQTCARSDEGGWMTHFTDCRGASTFSKRSK